MKKLFSVFLTLMLLCPAIAGAETITTNGGISLDTADLPYCTTDSDASVVYYISDISPEALVMMYDALGITLPGKVGVKMSTGESTRSNYLRPELITDLVHRGVQHSLWWQPFLHCHAPPAGEGQRPA